MGLPRMAGRAMLLRCPVCGAGRVIDGWIGLVTACPGCGHRFEREQGYWLGAVMLNTAAAIGLFAATFVTWTVLAWPDVPWTAVLVVTVAAQVVFPIVFDPFSRLLWVALDLAIHQGTKGRTEPPGDRSG